MDAALRQALDELQRAERNAVLYFAEIVRRKLYLDLGYANIHLYATGSLGFSRSRTYRFLRLVADLERLPRLRAAVAAGEVGWTKARAVVKVAGPSTEVQWIEAAKRKSRRSLEEEVHRVQRARVAKHRANPCQGEIPVPCSEAGRAGPGARASSAQALAASVGTASGGVGTASAGVRTASGGVGTASGATPRIAALQTGEPGAPAAAGGGAPGGSGPLADTHADGALATVAFRFEPLQLARYEALIERIRRARIVSPAMSREEILLLGLEQLLASGGQAAADRGGGPRAQGWTSVSMQGTDGVGEAAVSEAEQPANPQADPSPDETSEPRPESASRAELWPRGHSATNYRIIIYKCDTCRRAVVQTSRGEKAIAPDRLAAIECDAVVVRPGARNEATIAPSVRAAVMARDRHRCRAPGCANTRFLEVHHIIPREKGGSNRAENLVTLCSSCHRQWHARGLGAHFLRRRPADGQDGQKVGLGPIAAAAGGPGT